MTSKVGPKGQIVIPKPIRDSLGIRPGDEVVVEEQDGRAQVRKALTLEDVRGICPDGPGTADIEREHREELAREEAKYRRWFES